MSSRKKETVDDIDAKISALLERRRHAVMEDMRTEMELARLAAMTAGEIALAACGSDWRAIDLHALADVLGEHATACMRRGQEPATLTEASREIAALRREMKLKDADEAVKRRYEQELKRMERMLVQ